MNAEKNNHTLFLALFNNFLKQIKKRYHKYQLMHKQNYIVPEHIEGMGRVVDDMLYEERCGIAKVEAWSSGETAARIRYFPSNLKTILSILEEF